VIPWPRPLSVPRRRHCRSPRDGSVQGAQACIKFAADHPVRVAGLALFASLAKGSATPDYPHAGLYDMWLQHVGWVERARNPSTKVSGSEMMGFTSFDPSYACLSGALPLKQRVLLL
jgi:pimeloyl-ACP methyl ester carboxylesterase